MGTSLKSNTGKTGHVWVGGNGTTAQVAKFGGFESSGPYFSQPTLDKVCLVKISCLNLCIDCISQIENLDAKPS